jgi:hypothetical protein
MASTHKSLRSGTVNKRPTTSIAEGQIALNTNATSPGLFFKDSTGASIIKVGPVHVGSTAPNVSPAVGGSSGNSTGEVWLDNSLTPVGVKIWNGSAWVNATPIGSTTVQGLLELATDAETQAGSDTARAVTPASLQSKVSDSTSTTSSTTIASSTAVKSAYDLANAALPKSGGTITGNLEIGTTGNLSFEGATADGFETTIAVTDPTADRTITLPDTTGTIVTTGDTGTVTSTMILDGTIVNGDINASAAIAGTKISPNFGSQTITTTGVVSAALGAAATPSITFTGDLNTGIYSPGADQVAISTNGTGRLFVDASGQVHGTSYLDAGNVNSLVIRQGPGSTNAAALIESITSSSGERFALAFRAGATAGNASGSIVGSLSHTNTLFNYTIAGAHVFNTAGSERLRITSDGKVGLGTSTPNSPFEVGTLGINFDGAIAALPSSGADSAAFIARTASTGSAPFDQAGSIVYRPRVSATAGRSSHIFYTGSPSTIRMVINEAGNVGIGTTGPSELLHVNGNARANQFLTQGYFVGRGNLSTADLRSGFTSIGPASDSEPREFMGAYARFYGATHNTRPGDIEFGTGNNTAGSIQFRSNNTERARIDSSGRLLVGTSTARSNFQNGAVTCRAQIEGTDYQNTGLAIISNDSSSVQRPILYLYRSNGSSVGSNTLVASGDICGQVIFGGNDGSEFVNAAVIAAEIDGTPGANDMPGRLVFSTTADGSSSPTEQLRITSDRYVRLASGTGGIQFGGDTAAANALDDYEEGTFTPVIEGTTSAGTGTYGVQVGRYTKVGNRVFYNLYVVWTAHTGTGNMQLNGLPFTSSAVTNSFAAAASWEQNLAMTAGSIFKAYTATNSTIITLRQLPTGGGVSAAIPIDSAAEIMLSGHYFV